jgi:tetratricopeptide (TPR) repeat protein
LLHGNAYSKLGRARAVAGDLKGAIDAYRNSERVLGSLVRLASDPAHRSALAGAQMRLGYVLVPAGALDEALTRFRTAVEAGEDLLRAAPGHSGYQPDLILALIAAGDLLGSPFHINLAKPDDAARYYQRAHELAMQLAGADSRNARAQLSLATTTRRMATGLRDTNPAEALRQYREALRISERLLAQDPHNTEIARNHGFNLLESAYPLAKLGDRAEALKALREAIERQTATAGVDPARSQYRQDLVPTRVALARMLITARDFSAARSELDLGISLAEDRIKTSPDNLYSVRNLADCHEASADLETARGNIAAARRYRESSQALWRDWERAHGTNAYITLRKK